MVRRWSSIAGIMILQAAFTPWAVGEPATNSPKPLPRYGVFVFSNECTQGNGSGNVAGDRITLLRFPSGDLALYEYGNGGAQGPVLSESVNIDERTSAITIRVRDEWSTAPTRDGWGIDTIEGELTPESLIVKLHGETTTTSLPRIVGMPKPIGTCR